MHSLFFTLAASLTLQLATPELLSQNEGFWVKQLSNNLVEIRINAADRLGEIKTPTATAALGSSVNDPDLEVRFHLFKALVKNPSDVSLKALQDRGSQESDPYLAAELKRSVKQIQESIQNASDKADKAEQAAKNPKPSKAKAPKARAK